MDLAVQKLLLWLVTGLATGNIGLILSIWRGQIKRYEALERRCDMLDEQLTQLDRCIDTRLAVQHERRVMIQERLAALETGQQNVLSWLQRIAEQLDRISARAWGDSHGVS